MKSAPLNWRPVFAGFVMTFFSFGALFYSHGFYLTQLTQLHGWSISLVSGAVSTFWLAAAASGLVVGWRMDTGDPRWVALYGAVTLGLSLLALGALDKAWQLYLVYALLGTTYPALATPAVSGALARCFTNRYGAALSLAMTGASVGGIIAVPLLVWLTERSNFSSAVMVIGTSAIILIVPSTLWGFRGAFSSQGRAKEATLSHPALVLFQPSFWFVALGFGLAFSAQVGFVTHQLSVLITHTSDQNAAGVISLTVLSSMGGRFLIGYLSGIVPVRWLAVFSICILSVGISLVALADSLMHAILGSVTVGFVVAAITMLSAMVTRNVFGDTGFGRIFSYVTVVIYAGMGLGPWFAGYMLDLTGSYRIPFLCLAALGLIGAAFLIFGGRSNARRTSDL